MKQVRLRDEDHEALKQLQITLRKLTGSDVTLSQTIRYSIEVAGFILGHTNIRATDAHTAALAVVDLTGIGGVNPQMREAVKARILAFSLQVRVL